jgi:hypothetical protein
MLDAVLDRAGNKDLKGVEHPYYGTVDKNWQKHLLNQTRPMPDIPGANLKPNLRAP